MHKAAAILWRMQENGSEGGAGFGLGTLLGYLGYPWGMILQALALVHLVKRRGAFFWFWVIFIGGGLGALVYIVVEVVPDLGLVGDAFRRQGRKTRIRELETKIIDNPSAGNYEELAELYFDQGEFAKAREACSNAIGARADSLHTFYLRAKCALEAGDSAGAIPDLEFVVSKDGKFDAYRAEALLAYAYSMSGRMEDADAWFAHAVQFSTTLETEYNYARHLKARGRTPEAREWIEKILQKKRTMPHYQKRRERPWFRKVDALLKEMNKSQNSARQNGKEPAA